MSCFVRFVIPLNEIAVGRLLSVPAILFELLCDAKSVSERMIWIYDSKHKVY